MPCPLDIVYCECVVRTEPGGDFVEMRKLGMFDPHELLDYLWRNDHIRVPSEEIQTLILNLINFVWWYHLRHLTRWCIQSAPANFWILRKYWEHFSALQEWARSHPGKNCALPIALYGDDAKFSSTYLDKFTALALQSPLVWKQGVWANCRKVFASFPHNFKGNLLWRGLAWIQIRRSVEIQFSVLHRWNWYSRRSWW